MVRLAPKDPLGLAGCFVTLSICCLLGLSFYHFCVSLFDLTLSKRQEQKVLQTRPRDLPGCAAQSNISHHHFSLMKGNLL